MVRASNKRIGWRRRHGSCRYLSRGRRECSEGGGGDCYSSSGLGRNDGDGALRDAAETRTCAGVLCHVMAIRSVGGDIGRQYGLLARSESVGCSDRGGC
jgi:hypothetical protein